MNVKRTVAGVAAWLAFAALGYGIAMYLGLGQPRNTLAATQMVDIDDIDIALPGLDGQTRTLATWSGAPMMINVWGTWCAPCRREIPLLMALQEEFSAQGLTVVGIAIDELADARAYAEKSPFNYPILVGEADGAAMVSALGVTSAVVPVTAFVDREGLVRRLHLGEIHRDEAELALREILAP